MYTCNPNNRVTVSGSAPSDYVVLYKFSIIIIIIIIIINYCYVTGHANYT